MASIKGIAGWAQREMENALAKQGRGPKVQVTQTARKLRYIDPQDGRYYDAATDQWGAPGGGWGGEKGDIGGGPYMTATEIAQQAEYQRGYYSGERPKVEPTKSAREAEREYLYDLYRGAIERGDLSDAGHWMAKIAVFDEEDRKGKWLEGEWPPYQFGEMVVEAVPVPTEHKAGHFPTKWLIEAIDRAEQSTKCITFTFEREGIVVMAIEAGEKFAVKVSDWSAMEAAEENPLLHAIADCERKLDILQDLKKRAG
jgi:hypothetical protein